MINDPKDRLLLLLTDLCTFARLKKIVAISLLSVYLLSTTELYQLLKLPSLVHHFVEHKQENKDLTLWGFLYIHYAHDIAKDSDYDKDMKLPFKTHDGCTNSTISAFTAHNFSTEISKPVINESKIFPIYLEEFAAYSFLSKIWQPPKYC